MLYFAFDESLPDKVAPFGVQLTRSIDGSAPLCSRQSNDRESAAEQEMLAGLPDSLVFGSMFANPLTAWICALLGTLLGMTCGALLGMTCGALLGNHPGMFIGGGIDLLFSNILCTIAADEPDD